MVFDDDRVQVVAVGERLDGEQQLAVQRPDEGDAGVDRLVAQRAVLVRGGDDHGAGAAVARSAALLRAAAVPVQPEPVEHGQVGRHLVAEGDLLRGAFRCGACLASSGGIFEEEADHVEANPEKD